jgi:hypothetical protein
VEAATMWHGFPSHEVRYAAPIDGNPSIQAIAQATLSLGNEERCDFARSGLFFVGPLQRTFMSRLARPRPLKRTLRNCLCRMGMADGRGVLRAHGEAARATFDGAAAPHSGHRAGLWRRS